MPTESLALTHTVSMPEKKIRLVALDLDGTALDSRKLMLPGTIRVINEALDRGIEVVFCTGRTRCQYERFLPDLPKLRYAICAGGAVVNQVQTREKVISNEITVEEMQTILAVGQRHGCQPVLSIEGDSVHSRAVHEDPALYALEAYTYELNHGTICVDDVYAWYAAHRKPVESLALYADIHSRERLIPLREELERLPLHLTFPVEPCIEMNRKTADKGKALLRLCELLGISREETMTVGDGDNDLTAFRAAGWAVAMGNAAERIQQQADAVVADCDHEGVAEAFERFVF